MSRSLFVGENPLIDEDFVNQYDGLVNLELVSNAKTNTFKIKADFYLSVTEGLILEKITEIARG